MSEIQLLHILRKATSHSHQQIDGMGIAFSIRNQSFDEDDYKSWLKLTYSYLTSFLRVINDYLATSSDKYDISSWAEGVLSLKSDLNELNIDVPNCLFNMDPIRNKDQILVLEYIVLGSRRGNKIIKQSLVRNGLSLPDSYLRYTIESGDQWEAFAQKLFHHHLSISGKDLNDYSAYVFEEIHRCYSEILLN